MIGCKKMTLARKKMTDWQKKYRSDKTNICKKVTASHKHFLNYAYICFKQIEPETAFYLNKNLNRS